MLDTLGLLNGYGIIYDEDGVSHAWTDPKTQLALCGKVIFKSADEKTGVCARCRSLIKKKRPFKLASQKDRKMIIDLLKKHELIEMTMTPSEDGSYFNYNFTFKAFRNQETSP